MKIGDRRSVLHRLPQALPLEAVVWLAGLTFLLWLDPASGARQGPDLCLAHRLGIPFCPGCGLGRSIALALDGRPIDSFLTHPLGMPALAVLLARIVQLLVSHRGRRLTGADRGEFAVWPETAGRSTTGSQG
jgi:hypothetical protein